MPILGGSQPKSLFNTTFNQTYQNALNILAKQGQNYASIQQSTFAQDNASADDTFKAYINEQARRDNEAREAQAQVNKEIVRFDNLYQNEQKRNRREFEFGNTSAYQDQTTALREKINADNISSAERRQRLALENANQRQAMSFENAKSRQERQFEYSDKSRRGLLEAQTDSRVKIENAKNEARERELSLRGANSLLLAQEKNRNQFDLAQSEAQKESLSLKRKAQAMKAWKKDPNENTYANAMEAGVKITELESSNPNKKSSSSKKGGIAFANEQDAFNTAISIKQRLETAIKTKNPTAKVDFGGTGNKARNSTEDEFYGYMKKFGASRSDSDNLYKAEMARWSFLQMKEQSKNSYFKGLPTENE